MNDKQGSVEPTRVKLNSSLVRRPLFAGVDMEVLFALSLAVWFSFLVFKLSVPLFVVLVMAGIAYKAVKSANENDQFFLPILLRSLSYRRYYAGRAAAAEVSTPRPSLPRSVIET